MPITKQELLNAGDVVSSEHQGNFDLFREKINLFREKCGIVMIPTSYYRSKERQIRIYKEKAQKKEFPFANGIFDEKKVPMGSCHMKALACDFGGKTVALLKEWVLDNQDWCKENGFYFEDFAYTVSDNGGWIHIQVVPPASGKLFFKP